MRQLVGTIVLFSLISCAAATEALAIAVRDRMELAAHMTQWRVVGRDNATRLYRISLDFDWWLPRLT
jgi:hypothetical protein